MAVGPAAPAERPSRHDAGRVGGHDDRHRGERVATLGRADGGGERVEGARARRGPPWRGSARPDRTDGV